MITKIGQVTLDDTYYPGEDLYTDGAVEDRLLEIVTDTPEEELEKVIAQEKDWAILYHLSKVRENIIDALDFTGDEEVLEVGAGPGAVTGALTARARTVTAIDLSMKRSLINATRHKDAGNLQILVGNFADIEPHLPRTYDVITLIGVFEYARAYIHAEDPYGEFLRLLLAHLKENGRLIIAIENRLGLKYWAGCREDHTGNLFEGIENYPDAPGVQTFSRPELERMFENAGAHDWRFFYPYPDYKLPRVVYSDGHLPGLGELNTNIYNFDRERLVLFNEQNAFDSLIEAGEFPLFSNSYLVELKKRAASGRGAEEPGRLYARFSNERRRAFAIRTDIRLLEDGTKVVEKSACYEEGINHTEAMADHARKLEQQYKDTKLSINRVLGIKKPGTICFEYLESRSTLEEKAVALLKQGKQEEALSLIRELASLVRSAADRPFAMTPEFETVFGLSHYAREAVCASVSDLDMTAENILISPDGSDWTLIDYEWTFSFPVPVDFVIYRIWHYFLSRAGLPEKEKILEQEGFDGRTADLFNTMEKSLQAYFKGEAVPLRELYSAISPGLRDIEAELMLEEHHGKQILEGTLYYLRDETEAFTPENSISTAMHADENGRFEVTFPLQQLGQIKKLRWDPAENRLLKIRICEVEADRLVMITPMNAFDKDGWDEFWTMDPAYSLEGDFSGLETVTVRGELKWINLLSSLGDMAQIRAERDAYYEEMERLRAHMNALRSTKAFKGIEVLRRIRNFIMARVRGMYLFRDKNAGPKMYQKWFREHKASEAELAAQRITVLSGGPKISILVPTYQTPESYLKDMIDSVKAQTYGNWELCIADASIGPDGERNGQIVSVLKEYADADARILVKYLEKNEGISENTNAAAAMASGDYIALLDHDDLLAPNALFEVAQAVIGTGADMLYTDEDKIAMDGGDHFDPNLKPDFSPDLLRSHNYITHLLVLRTDLFMLSGGLRAEYNGAQDYDLIFRCSEKAEKIVHIPKILYYWRMHNASTAANPKSKMYAYEAGQKAIEDHLKRMGYAGTVERLEMWGMNRVRYDTPGEPLVSVIIPNKDHVSDLDRCVQSLLTKSDYRKLELIIAENNSEQAETFAYYEKICSQYPQVRVIKWEKPFNYSAINNFGAQEARGSYLLLLNNDTELIEPSSVREMLGFCMREDVGAVGAKLFFKDNTVQHAGIVLGFGGFAGHVFSGRKKKDNGFMLRARIAGNYSAVTGACLMVSKKHYFEVGGLNEELAVALNDVDFCLKLREKGYVNVFTPFAQWYHFESKSRGYEDTPEKKERFGKEIAVFRRRWGSVVDAGDPYYNPNFSVDREPFTLW